MIFSFSLSQAYITSFVCCCSTQLLVLVLLLAPDISQHGSLGRKKMLNEHSASQTQYKAQIATFCNCAMSLLIASISLGCYVSDKQNKTDRYIWFVNITKKNQS